MGLIVLTDYHRLSQALRRKTDVLVSPSAVAFGCGTMLVTGLITEIIKRMYPESWNHSQFGLTESQMSTIESYSLMLIGVLSVMFCQRQSQQKQIKRVFRELHNTVEVKSLFTFKRQSNLQHKGLTLAEFMQMRNLQLQPDQYSQQQVDTLIRATRRINDNKTSAQIFLNKLRIAFILLLFTQKICTYSVYPFIDMGKAAIHTYCDNMNELYRKANLVGVNDGVHIPLFDCLQSEKEPYTMYLKLQYSPAHNLQEQRDIVRTLFKLCQEDLNIVITSSQKAYFLATLSRFLFKTFMLANTISNAIVLKEYSRPFISHVLSLAMAILSYMTFLQLLVNFMRDIFHKNTTKGTVTAMKHYALIAGAKIKAINISKEHRGLKAIYLHQNKADTAFFSYLLQVFGYSAYGISLHTNILYQWLTYIDHVIRPMKGNTLNQVVN
jgi:hypothetical protein